MATVLGSTNAAGCLLLNCPQSCLGVLGTAAAQHALLRLCCALHWCAGVERPKHAHLLLQSLLCRTLVKSVHAQFHILLLGTVELLTTSSPVPLEAMTTAAEALTAGLVTSVPRETADHASSLSSANSRASGKSSGWASCVWTYRLLGHRAMKNWFRAILLCTRGGM